MRQSTPVIGALCDSPDDRESDKDSKDTFDGVSFRDPKRWQLAFGSRWQRSHRHFVGTKEQRQRLEQATEVVNKMLLLDVAATYTVNERFNLSVSVPIMSAHRKIPGRIYQLRGIANAPDQLQDSAGIGDMSIVSRYGLFKDAIETGQNIWLGLGVKLPTGPSSVRSTVNTVNGRAEVVDDQSIQLGDGGVGVVLDLQAYKRLRSAITLYASGVYLMNPRNTNGVPTGRARPSEAIMSVADQYLARAGAMVPVPRARGLALSLGGRIEGVPVKDLIGRSDGFRRPGYAITADPGLVYSRGKGTWSLSVPVAVRRNRQRSVSDWSDGTHGDAAFADYLILFSYSRRF